MHVPSANSPLSTLHTWAMKLHKCWGLYYAVCRWSVGVHLYFYVLDHYTEVSTGKKRYSAKVVSSLHRTTTSDLGANCEI